MPQPHSEPTSVGSAPAPLGVFSESGRLRRVLVCAPSLAHERLNPATCHELLFDDVMWVDQARRDHAEFVRTMRTDGVEVLELHDVLAAHPRRPRGQGLAARPHTSQELRRRARLSRPPSTPGALAWRILGGLTVDELPDGVSRADRSRPRARTSTCSLPSRTFSTRATPRHGSAVASPSTPCSSPPATARALILETVYRFHPDFAGVARVWWGDGERRIEEEPLEGGDLLVAGNGVVLAGAGERTSPAAIRALASSLFAAGAATRVIVATLPHERRAMHLDSVLTFADRDCVTAYPPIVDAIRSVSLRPSDADPSLLEEREEDRSLRRGRGKRPRSHSASRRPDRWGCLERRA